MITLITNQILFSDENLKVFEGGDFADTDLVQVYNINDPSTPIYNFQAFFIQNGYNFESNENYSGSVFKINSTTENPSFIDYDILGFNKKRIIEKGELKQIEYYKNYDSISSQYSDLVVTEFREYVRDSLGIVQYRNQTSNWICNDDSTGLTLNFIKYYSPEEAIQEGIDRRGNMISFAKSTLLEELKNVFGEPTNQSYAFDLLLSIKTQMDYFVQGYTQPLRDAVSASTKAYMLIPGIKESVIEQLTF